MHKLEVPPSGAIGNSKINTFLSTLKTPEFPRDKLHSSHSGLNNILKQNMLDLI